MPPPKAAKRKNFSYQMKIITAVGVRFVSLWRAFDVDRLASELACVQPSLAMEIILQCAYFQISRYIGLDSLGGGNRAREGRIIGNFMQKRGSAQGT